MVAGLVILFKVLEIITGEYFGIQSIASMSAWAVTLITGFLFFMITVQLHFYLRDKALEKQVEAVENSKV